MARGKAPKDNPAPPPDQDAQGGGGGQTTTVTVTVNPYAAWGHEDWNDPDD